MLWCPLVCYAVFNINTIIINLKKGNCHFNEQWQEEVRSLPNICDDSVQHHNDTTLYLAQGTFHFYLRYIHTTI